MKGGFAKLEKEVLGKVEAVLNVVVALEQEYGQAKKYNVNYSL